MNKKLSLWESVKNFLGIFSITPFEKALLDELKNHLSPKNRAIIDNQISTFTTVRRLIRHINEPGAHGFTNFYTLRFGKSISDKKHDKKFKWENPEELLAIAKVTFDGGEINVKFWLVRGILFRIEYRSPQNIYYPPKEYRIEKMSVCLKD